MYKFLTCFALTAVPLIGKPHCPFCDPAVLQKQAYYENDHAIALLTHKPIFPGHSLIIPKRHIERLEELTHEELLALFDLIKKVDHAVSKTFHTSTYLIDQKNGAEVGQSVPHIHFHYISRKQGDTSMVKFAWRIVKAYLKKPLTSEEMAPILQALKDNSI